MNCKLVSSRGILDLCDWRSHEPVSSTTSLNYNKPIEWLDNETPTVLYVCTTALPTFIHDVLPKINKGIILVSGDCDITVPDQLFRNYQDFENFINNDVIVHWFCQNFVGKHSKVSQIPIGMDYHTMAEQDHWWGKKLQTYKQEQQLFDIKDNSLPFWERKLKIYSSFHVSMTHRQYVNDRRDAIEKIPKDLIDYDEKCERLHSWKKQTEYAFVACPHGNGLDTHRFWEALNLGCIPIIKTSGLDPLFDNLPVWIVESWDQVSIVNMKNKIEEFRNKTFNYEKLTTNYWFKKIYSFKFDLTPIFDSKITIGGCVKNCSKHSSYILKNITLLKSLFKKKPKVLVSYDDSDDDTYDKYSYADDVEVLTGENLLHDESLKNNSEAIRVSNICNARNRILSNMEGEYLIMVDLDGAFSKQLNLNSIRNVFNEPHMWDIVSFNNTNYYDLWALTIGPFKYSCWHTSDPYKIINEMKKYLSWVTHVSKTDYIPCESAFDVLSIYRVDKIKNLRYSPCYDKSYLNLLDIQNFCKIYDVRVSVPNTVYDCEHRHFARLAAYQGAKVKIYKYSAINNEVRT